MLKSFLVYIARQPSANH